MEISCLFASKVVVNLPTTIHSSRTRHQRQFFFLP
ncbi:hypothetical protein Goklo_016318 [Gossypium klotzschianum]|uniref:Uncharacterized protein n=1 Tax=Gossypium klotzschianum TaxID=34286 RepID=A0A7J8UEB6_9ROSI|nr:hypothetical protein [Gossypium klotzschianum]